MKTKVVVACCLILAGSSLLAFPWVQAWRYQAKNADVMEKWESAAGNQIIVQRELSAINRDEAVWHEDFSMEYDSEYVLDYMEAIIEIDKIDLQSPVLYGETKYNLDMAVCRLFNSVGPGANGNYCLAGHESRVYGKQFNRLKEVEPGDMLLIKTRQAEYEYKVVKAFAVGASDSWVLENDFETKQITLVTCDFAQVPLGRYIIQGELIES